MSLREEGGEEVRNRVLEEERGEGGRGAVLLKPGERAEW